MLRNEANYRVQGTVKNSKTLALSQLIVKKRNKIHSSVLYFSVLEAIPGGVLPYMGYIGMCRCEGLSSSLQRVWV